MPGRPRWATENLRRSNGYSGVEYSLELSDATEGIFGAWLGCVERRPTGATKHRIFLFCLGNLAAHYGVDSCHGHPRPGRR